jgi:hypothetical protein
MRNADMPAMPNYNADAMTLRSASRLVASGGLTKREAFAMAAMQGLCSKQGAYDRAEHLALDAVYQADAVLAALSAMQPKALKVQP